MIRRSVFVACAAAFAIGLFFIFVWAPHPWGWEGFDEYHTLALTLARGEPYPTVDRPWGYAFFLAGFYRLFGDRPVVPLVVQAGLNALLPLLVFEFARTEFDERTAAAAAVLTGVFSFNTVYASTQASDALCTVIFMAAVLLVARARRHRDDWRQYTAAGLLLGVAPQFRPNLILVSPLIAVFLIAERRSLARMRAGTIVIVASIAVLVPWMARNERLTGEPLPTTTHGGMQLWYGTLETGSYLTSRSYNPRAVFETATFPSTSLDRLPVVVTGRLGACANGQPPVLVYWTDRDDSRRRVSMDLAADGAVQAEMLPAVAPTTYYYSVDGPNRPDPAPFVYFVSTDQLGDLDRRGDLLDVFDLVRLARHVAWREPLPFADRLDFDADGRITDEDVRRSADVLLAHAQPPGTRAGALTIEREPESLTLRFGDGSTIVVPRRWSGRVTDLDVDGILAATVLHTSVPFAKLQASNASCTPVEDLAVNAVYYRAEPTAMRRYLALAYDNIRRDPAAYLASVAYRAVRVFVIEGSNDPHTAYQFSGSGRIYRAAQAVSVIFLALFAGGIVAAKRRGAAIALPLVLIAYIPATLAFVLINMRYSITVQPLMFIFVAALLVTAWERAAAGRRHAGSETARQP